APAAAINCIMDGDVCWPMSYNDPRILPPKRFDKPWDGVLHELQAQDMDDMGVWCSPLPAGVKTPANKLLGCSTTRTTSNGERHCWIFIASELYLRQHGVSREAVKRHEVGHCWGWTNDHPR